MDCEWHPFKNQVKCKNCGRIQNKAIRRNCPAKKKPPNIAKKAKNFTKAAKKHIQTGMKYCTPEQKKERFNICQSNKCGLFRKKGDGGICAHDDCGCPIRSKSKFIDKLSWVSSKCPLNFW